MKYLIILTSMLCSLSYAHEGVTGIVKERMDVMSSIGTANKMLTNIARGKADFDLEQIHTVAELLAKSGGETLLQQFPVGSHSEMSEAAPAIWQNWPDFSAKALELQLAGQALADIESESEFKEAYYRVSDSCSGCHRNYRLKKGMR